MQVYKYASMQVHKYANIQACKYASAKCASVQVWKLGRDLVNEQLFCHLVAIDDYNLLLVTCYYLA